MDVDMESNIKCEPASPLGLSRCSQPSLEDSFGRDVFVDYNPDDYGSDKSYQGDSGDNSGNISPCSIENSLDNSKLDYCTSTLILSDHDNSDGNSDGPKRVCLVCGDVASGYHYGVSSCEACKAFFKRTIQGNIEYSCPANGDCEITKRRRKACQACRFQKCLQVGMLREGVRLDRVRGGRQKYKRGLESPVIQTILPMVKKPCYEGIESKILTQLMSIESQLDKLYANVDNSLDDEEVKLLAAISDLADRELVITISWAKQVPGFLNMSLSDQMNLLQHSWLEILCLNLIFRSCPYSNSLKFAEDLLLSPEESKLCMCSTEFDNLTRKLCRKFTNLSVTKEEYLMLKAMILCNIDVITENAEAVKTLQEKLQDSLLDYVKSRNGGSLRRLGQLYLLLPPLTHMKLLARQHWFDIKNDGRVLMHKLFLEMLEADS